MGFYIHIADPQFSEEPWPGVRRLGPFLTQEEALAQAASDAAYGGGVAVGIYDEAGSEQASTDPQAAVPVHTSSEIQQQADIIVQERDTNILATMDQDRQDVVATMPTAPTGP